MGTHARRRVALSVWEWIAVLTIVITVFIAASMTWMAVTPPRTLPAHPSWSAPDVLGRPAS